MHQAQCLPNECKIPHNSRLSVSPAAHLDLSNSTTGTTLPSRLSHLLGCELRLSKPQADP
jgi:hypothetical protein